MRVLLPRLAVFGAWIGIAATLTLSATAQRIPDVRVNTDTPGGAQSRV